MPDRHPQGGIWVYNKSKHPAEMDNNDWNNEDCLLIQIGDKKYSGKGMDVSALQKVSNDVVKIVVKFNDTDGVSGKDPRRYLSFQKGSLDYKKFIVETENGEHLQVR